MPYYRCYFLSEDHAIAAVEAYDAASDKEAREKAEALFRQRRDKLAGFEIWAGSRRIHRQLGRLT
jgi:hypothetical protein